MKIYAGGKSLAEVPVTQNEVGWYYWNGASYYKPVLAEFDTASLPTGYKKYTNGSHTAYLSQNAIDFSIVAGTAITFSEEVTVLLSSTGSGSFCKLSTSRGIIYLVHTYKWASGKVPAGTQVCQVAPQSVTGFAPHLHIYKEGGRVRDIILGIESMKKGDYVEFFKDTNMRGDPTKPAIDVVVKAGAVAQIIDGPRTYAPTGTPYPHFDVKFLNRTGWVFDQNMKVTDKRELTDHAGGIPTPPPVEPPTPPAEPLEDRVKRLEVAMDSILAIKR